MEIAIVNEEQEIAGGVIYDRPGLTARGKHIPMNDNMIYSTVARDRENETMRESENRTEPEQITWREQIAMNVNQAHSTVTRGTCRRFKEDEAERESGDMPNERLRLETVEMIRNRAGGEQIAMNANQVYSSLARDKKQMRECEAEAEMESRNMPEERLRLKPVDKPEQLATDEELFAIDNTAYSEQAGVICDQLRNEKVLEKTAPTERKDWCDSWRAEWL